MSKIVIPVAGFRAYPDGRLRAGPFNLHDVGALNQLLEYYGVRPGTPGDTGFVSQTADGIMISASGSGVKGYFLNEDGTEIDRDALDAFLLGALPDGGACNIAGHWSPDPDRSIHSQATAFRFGMRIDWLTQRNIHHRDGTVTPILPRAGEAPKLRIIA